MKREDELKQTDEQIPPQVIERTIHIEATVSAVWEAVRNFGDHEKWMPDGGEDAPQLTWSGDPNTPGTVRRFTVPGQPAFAERLNSIDEEKHKIAYSIVESPFEIEGHEATISIDADGGGSIASWTAKFHSDDATAEQLDSFMGTQNFEPGLAGLKKYVESHTKS